MFVAGEWFWLSGASSPRVPTPHLKICSVPGCGGKHRGRGLCKNHYQRLFKKGVHLSHSGSPTILPVSDTHAGSYVAGRVDWRARRAAIVEFNRMAEGGR